MSELIEVKNEAFAVQNQTPMQAILNAISAGGVDPKALELMMNLQERFDQSEAKKAFNIAFTAFKSANITVAKTKQVSFGNTKYKHAELSNVCETIGHELAKNGLSYRWIINTNVNGSVSVKCILSHEKGHSEETEMSAPPDSSGNKNSVQQIASTVTYLQRYTLLSITGTATGEDNDSKVSGIDSFQLQTMIDDILSCEKPGDVAGKAISYLAFCAEQKDSNAAKQITAAIDKKRAEFKSK